MVRFTRRSPVWRLVQPLVCSLCLLTSAAVVAAPALKKTAVQLHAGTNVTEAEVASVEALVCTQLAPPLKARGFAMVPVTTVQAALTHENVPRAEWHQADAKQADAVILGTLHGLDVQLHWLGTLSRDGEQLKLQLTAAQWHNAVALISTQIVAKDEDELSQKLAAQGPDLVAQALHTFKETPKPIWWRPTNFTPPPHVANAGPHGAGLDENAVAHK
ncbi:MAG: hypothetical protein JST92_20125 [Deltaproteobacteria bacterium]|nr:hypothetical protein [Deltaproteobacteria bacterium]